MYLGGTDPLNYFFLVQINSASVDVWSIGVIFAELMKRKPFLPGASSSDQLIRTFDIIGTPTQQEIQ